MIRSVQWKRSRVALAFTLIFVVGISISSAIAFPLFNVSTTESKRFGMWLQYLSELHNEDPYEFYQTYFLTPPYFSALEIIFPVWHQQYDNFVSWMDTVANYADSHPTVQIYVMLALDMDSPDHWNRVENCLQHWDDNPSIYSVGVNCEHSKLHFPNSFDHDGFEHFETLSNAYGKQFICYYFQNAPETRTKSDFQWIAHVNWPYRGHRISLNVFFATNTQQVGISAGLYAQNPDSYPDPDEPNPNDAYLETEQVGWSRASIQYMLDIGFTHSHEERRCLLFSQLGLWNDGVFRHDIYILSAPYSVIMADPFDLVYTDG